MQNKIYVKTFENFIQDMNDSDGSRKCTSCNTPMLSGFVINGGDKYYCDEQCMETDGMSVKEYLGLHTGLEGEELDNYYNNYMAEKNGEEFEPNYRYDEDNEMEYGDDNDDTYWTEWDSEDFDDE